MDNRPVDFDPDEQFDSFAELKKFVQERAYGLTKISPNIIFDSPDIQKALIVFVANNKTIIEGADRLNDDMLTWMAQNGVCIDGEGEPFRRE